MVQNKTNTAAEITKQTKVPTGILQAKPRLIEVLSRNNRIDLGPFEDRIRDLANFIATIFETCDPIFKMASLDTRGFDMRFQETVILKWKSHPSQ